MGFLVRPSLGKSFVSIMELGGDGCSYSVAASVLGVFVFDFNLGHRLTCITGSCLVFLKGRGNGGKDIQSELKASDCVNEINTHL